MGSLLDELPLLLFDELLLFFSLFFSDFLRFSMIFSDFSPNFSYFL